MPPLTRAFIRSALLYLVAGLLIGLLLSLQRPLGLPGWVGGLRPVFYHLLMVGWATQLIFGVIFWMFPKISRERPRGREGLVRFAFWTLNGGLLLRLLLEPLPVARAPGWAGAGLGLAALLQVAAVSAFVVAAWPRVRGKG